MFGRSALGKYLYYKENPRPTVVVSEEEFVKVWVENGGTEERGKFQLSIAKGLGSSVAIGDKFYKVEVKD